MLDRRLATFSLLLSLALVHSGCKKASEEKKQPAPPTSAPTAATGDDTSGLAEASAARVKAPPQQAPASPAKTPLKQPPPWPAVSGQDEPDDPVQQALEELAKQRHASDIESLSLVTIQTKKTKRERAFYLYAYSSFEEWKGKKRAAGELTKITKELKQAQEDCQKDANDKEHEAEREVERLRAVAAKSGKESDEEAAEEAEMELDQLQFEEPLCPDWSDYFAGADVAESCDPDIAVLAAYDVTRAGEPAKLSFTRVGAVTLETCGLSEEDFSGQLHAEDFDKDGSQEVVLTWEKMALYAEMGRGDEQSIPAGTVVKVFREDMTIQGQWSANITPSPDDDQDMSGRLLSWFEDKSGDGRKDFIYREMAARPGCLCGEGPYAKEKEIDAWRDRVMEDWHLEYEQCADDEAEGCKLASDKTSVMTYDAKADTWK